MLRVTCEHLPVTLSGLGRDHDHEHWQCALMVLPCWNGSSIFRPSWVLACLETFRYETFGTYRDSKESAFFSCGSTRNYECVVSQDPPLVRHEGPNRPSCIKRNLRYGPELVLVAHWQTKELVRDFASFKFPFPSSVLSPGADSPGFRLPVASPSHGSMRRIRQELG